VSRVPAGDEQSRQTVVFNVRASFVFQDAAVLRGYTPPPPPGLLTVPYDVFYPFIGSTSSGTIAAPAPGGSSSSGITTLLAHFAVGLSSIFCVNYFF
jgi:hypothetical protein